MLGIKLTLSSEAGNKIGLQSEQRLVKQAGLVGLHPGQPGKQQLLEMLRVKIGKSELEKTTGNDRRCCM
jgi:hypothetical protein